MVVEKGSFFSHHCQIMVVEIGSIYSNQCQIMVVEIGSFYSNQCQIMELFLKLIWKCQINSKTMIKPIATKPSP